jgi:hypothetical protein
MYCVPDTWPCTHRKNTAAQADWMTRINQMVDFLKQPTRRVRIELVQVEKSNLTVRKANLIPSSTNLTRAESDDKALMKMGMMLKEIRRRMLTMKTKLETWDSSKTSRELHIHDKKTIHRRHHSSRYFQLRPHV